MAKYESLPTIPFRRSPYAHPTALPEVVHLDDSALAVMLDFTHTSPLAIGPNDSIDTALDEMKIAGTHLLLVVDDEHNVIGIIGSEDILGEKPINIIQERRIQRSEILVKMVMRPEANIIAFDIDTLKHAKVGNVINTLKELHRSYALVVKKQDTEQIVQGLFSISQISKQLHMSLSDNTLWRANSIAELQKRSK